MKNILVFPCGSEIALEIYKSLEYSIHFNLFGGSSVKDHGEFVYKNYIPNIPFHNDDQFIPILNKIIQKYSIDAIYPAMDLVSYTLKKNENILNCKVIASPLEVTQICSSKKNMYETLKETTFLPQIYNDIESSNFPIFIKPDIGYGSRNTFFAKDKNSAENFLKEKKEIDFVLCEYLPYEEYTIDCFSNRKGELLFSKARQRARISNGISVNTIHTQKHKEIFNNFAKAINNILKPRGAWFFQVKEDKNKNPKLLEIACRLAGSSSLCRVKGVNFALLTLFDAFDIDVTINENDYTVELDRALNNKYKIDINYSTIYIDFDDCILLKDKVNTKAISFLYKALNDNKKLILLTRHKYDINLSLKKYRLDSLFDKVYHLTKDEKKSTFIKNKNSIFIDDSYQERSDVILNCNIPVFSPDMIEVLL